MALVATPETRSVGGIEIDVLLRGEGQPLLFLHPEIGLDRAAPVLGRLAAQFRLIAPFHPGYGAAPAVPALSSVDDLAYLYLDLLETLDLRETVLVGVGLGGWIAAEIATKGSERLSHLILADAVGVKLADRTTREIADVFALTEEEIAERAWANPARGRLGAAASGDDEALLALARARESTARYAWQPYMHNPKLKGRLHRIAVPTLVLWGAADRIVTPEYGRGYAQLIGGARFALIEGAGHYPHLERPEEFSDRVLDFVRARLAA